MKKFYQGLIIENPVFVQFLGMCPALGVTTEAVNGLGMGIATMLVLICSNVAISLLRNIIPSKVRIPAFIVIIATFVTVVDLLLQAYFFDLYKAIAAFVPLIVVNCLILGRAEAYAYKNKPVASAIDGLAMGIGFTFALVLLGSVREIIGSGTIFGINLPSILGIESISIIALPPGAFIMLAFLIALNNKVIKSLKGGK